MGIGGAELGVRGVDQDRVVVRPVDHRPHRAGAADAAGARATAEGLGAAQAASVHRPNADAVSERAHVDHRIGRGGERHPRWVRQADGRESDHLVLDGGAGIDLTRQVRQAARHAPHRRQRLDGDPSFAAPRATLAAQRLQRRVGELGHLAHPLLRAFDPRVEQKGLAVDERAEQRAAALRPRFVGVQVVARIGQPIPGGERQPGFSGGFAAVEAGCEAAESPTGVPPAHLAPDVGPADQQREQRDVEGEAHDPDRLSTGSPADELRIVPIRIHRGESRALVLSSTRMHYKNVRNTGGPRGVHGWSADRDAL